MIYFAVMLIISSSLNIYSDAREPNITSTSLNAWPEKHPPINFHPKVTVPNLPPYHSPPLQSPINIRDNYAVKARLPPLKFEDLLTSGVMVTMTNTGLTVNFEIVEGSATNPRLVGGPLTGHGEFQFSSFHIHWGNRDFSGGEHKINNHRFAIEGHSVHFNMKYGNKDEAMKYSDGLAVVAFFAEARIEDNKKIAHLIDLIPNITYPESSVILPARRIFNWFADLAESNQYYTYPGSLTTPPYTENVFWIVYPEPMKIGRRQVEAFRSILSDNLKEIRKNIRLTKPLNGRPLIYNV